MIKVKFKQVSFRSSVQLAPFQHATIEVTAEVQAGQSPVEVLDEVKRFVAIELVRAKRGVEPKPKPVQQGKFSDMLQVSEDTWARPQR